MAERTLLYQGSFNDKEGNIIRVSFYKRVDINAYPEHLVIDASGGTLSLEVWSKDGEAGLADPQAEWYNWRQVGAERIPGTRWHKYFYEIDVDENPGTSRSTEISVFNDDGEIAHMTVSLRQSGQA